MRRERLSPLQEISARGWEEARRQRVLAHADALVKLAALSATLTPTVLTKLYAVGFDFRAAEAVLHRQLRDELTAGNPFRRATQD